MAVYETVESQIAHLRADGETLARDGHFDLAALTFANAGGVIGKVEGDDPTSLRLRLMSGVLYAHELFAAARYGMQRGHEEATTVNASKLFLLGQQIGSLAHASGAKGVHGFTDEVFAASGDTHVKSMRLQIAAHVLGERAIDPRGNPAGWLDEGYTNNAIAHRPVQAVEAARTAVRFHRIVGGRMVAPWIIRAGMQALRAPIYDGRHANDVAMTAAQAVRERFMPITVLEDIVTDPVRL